MRLKEVDEE